MKLAEFLYDNTFHDEHSSNSAELDYYSINAGRMKIMLNPKLRLLLISSGIDDFKVF